MKPYQISEQRVPIELGDVLFVMTKRQLYFVNEIRHNRRRYDEADVPTTGTVITLSDLVGNIPNRFVRFNAVGVIETTGDGHISNIERGAQGMLSDVNTDNIELDEALAGEQGGATGRLRFGAMPLDYWSFATEDEYKITVVADTGTATLGVALDVTEYKCSQKNLSEFDLKGLPEELVLIGYFGTRRMPSADFDRLQQWL